MGTFYNSKAAYKCLPGYQLSETGTSTVAIRCTEAGSWEPVPKCQLQCEGNGGLYK